MEDDCNLFSAVLVMNGEVISANALWVVDVNCAAFSMICLQRARDKQTRNGGFEPRGVDGVISACCWAHSDPQTSGKCIHRISYRF